MGIAKKLTSFLTCSIFSLLLSNSPYAQTGWEVLNPGTTSNFSVIEFIDQNTGFISDPLLKTTNGGINWIPVSGVTTTASGIDFVDYDYGYISDYSAYKTTNGGVNWVDQNQSNFNVVYFIDRDTGYVGTDYNGFGSNIWKTTNGGINWINIFYDPAWLTMTSWQIDIKFVSPAKGYAVLYHEDSPEQTHSSSIYRTTNYGNNWSEMCGSTLYHFEKISYPSQDTGYAAVSHSPYFYSDSSYVFKIINGSWTVSYEWTNRLNSVYFPSTSTGYAVGVLGKIAKTTDGGASWRTLNTGTTLTLRNVYFINDMTGYVVGNNGIVLKTTTGGESANTISGTVRYQDNNQPVTSGYVKAVRYDEQTQNIITVDSTGILSNGAYTLIHCPPIPVDIMAFQDDEEDGYFVPTYYVSTIYWENAVSVTADSNLTGIDIGVFRINNTSDNKHIGGSVYSSGNVDLSALKDAIIYARIGTEYKGYSVTGNSGAYRIDSLVSGTYELIANRMGYYSAIRPYLLTSVSVDDVDFILNLVVSKEPNTQNVPLHYWISQNYPNPFNPSTKIKFGMPFGSYAKLIVYDLLGREAAVLVNEELKAGEYSVEWNASGLSSGVYFYRLIAGDYIETRKMVLLK